MKNRLELFRSQIAAFDGAADPMNAISKGYFIEEPHQSSTNALFKRISLRPQSKILLIGGIGSGKTTQLLRLQQLFQEAPDIGIYPHYVDITEYTKPDDIQIGTLDAIVALELMKLLERDGFQLDETRKTSIQNFAYGYDKTDSMRNLIEDLQRVSGVLNPPSYLQKTLSQMGEALVNLIENFKTKFHQTPYFLFDGLDRLDEVKKVVSIASSDLEGSEIGFAIVGATSLFYDTSIISVDNIFNHIEYRSAFDVDRDEEAQIFFERVLLARSGQDFFQKDALGILINLSGGVLRDLINLAQESIQEAYLEDSEIVDREHVVKAVRSLGRAKILGLDSEQFTTLRNFTSKIIMVPTTPEEIYLLSGGRILEYRFPERRFDVHPVLKYLLT
jgi:energy-coupling factor transporter ATP-binding protein EcfA2